MYGKYGDIEEEVRFMVKSFYDPKVEDILDIATGEDLQRYL